MQQEGLVLPPSSLRNSYIAIRHGQSTANVVNIISSDVVTGSTQHGLTELGRTQAYEAGVSLWGKLQEDGVALDDVIVYSSNFTRARETKEIAVFELQRQWQSAHGSMESPVMQIGLLEDLRERDFGNLDGKPTGAYDQVWPRDMADAFDGTDGVEPVAAVCARLRRLVDFLEARHAKKTIALCAHADTIQIFQCWMAQSTDVRAFSSYRFKNGEVRRCDTAGSDLPPPAEMMSQQGTAQ